MKLSELNRGFYAAVRFSDSTVHHLTKLQKELKIPFPVKAEDLHCTVVYSRVIVPFRALDDSYLLANKGTLDTFTNKNGTNALVLRFDSEHLQERHKYAKILGATYDFPEYLPHITLSYDVGSIQYTGEFEFPIEMTHEYTEEINF
ncbi:RNA ligase [Pseudomonas phage PspYZU05]|uniref:Anti-CBASS protein Acb1 n=1 Tax=Pseudomonas phage PspYZU05 TaxID=1983556 RepID=A0A2U7N529_9CAUD|nr:RNA ligase [Pseudomonas phage PspYZU05]ASD52056.1 hypothetical protein PspYZU05_104 [Pseudomonas phage PspYZU05]